MIPAQTISAGVEFASSLASPPPPHLRDDYRHDEDAPFHLQVMIHNDQHIMMAGQKYSAKLYFMAIQFHN